jgi:LmbE family N-acetylglucosaminyl deacetylase
MSEKENIVCVFAHPDDEAMGPSGIIAKWALRNNVYLICVTDGSQPNRGVKKLAQTRKQELLNSAKILGIKKVYFLGYRDGELRNNIYHKVAKDIEKILIKLKPKILLTFETRGVSGHLDHVFVSLVTSFVFQKLKFIKKIYYAAILKKHSQQIKDYFIYFPEGYDRDQIDHIEDVAGVWDKKIEAIKAHKSQKRDVNRILKRMKTSATDEFFLVRKR